jgi:hypothetical protein
MKRRSIEQWRELFAQQDTSGVSAAEFCKQNDLCPKYFSLRRKQLAKTAGKVETGFARVNIKPDVTNSAPRPMTNALVIHSNAGKLVFGTLPQP